MKSTAMAMDEQQTLLGSSAGGRSQLSVTIVEMVTSTPQPSPMSDRSSQQLISESTATGEPVIVPATQQKDEGT